MLTDGGRGTLKGILYYQPCCNLLGSHGSCCDNSLKDRFRLAGGLEAAMMVVLKCVGVVSIE